MGHGLEKELMDERLRPERPPKLTRAMSASRIKEQIDQID